MANKEITLDELKGHLGQLGNDEVVLDVRKPDEYSAGHIPGSLNINHEQIPEKVDELKKFKTIFIHCKMGGRAKMAYQILQSLGFENLVCISDAGFAAWSDRGYPVE